MTRSGGEQRTVELTLHLHAETDRAIRVSTDGYDGRACWLPLSQVQVAEHKHWAKTVEVELPEWMAIDRGLV